MLSFLCYSVTINAQAATEQNTQSEQESPQILHDTDDLYFSVMSEENSIQFSRVGYNTNNSELVFSTGEIVEYIEIYKREKLYLKRLPVFTNNLYINMKNFERGLYKLHLISNETEEPVIAYVLKKHL